MRRIFTVVGAGLAALALASTAEAAWVLEQVPEHEFQAMFPKKPTREVSTENGVTMTSFSAANGGALCMIVAAQYPEIVDSNLEMPASRDNFLKGVGATLTTSKRTAFSRGSKQLDAMSFEAESADYTFRSLIVIEDARVYQVAAGIPKPDGDDAELAACVNGFSLMRR